MIITINKKALAYARMQRINQELKELQPRIKRIEEMASDAKFYGDEEKMHRYAKIANELNLKFLELSMEFGVLIPVIYDLKED